MSPRSSVKAKLASLVASRALTPRGLYSESFTAVRSAGTEEGPRPPFLGASIQARDQHRGEVNEVELTEGKARELLADPVADQFALADEHGHLTILTRQDVEWLLTGEGPPTD